MFQPNTCELYITSVKIEGRTGRPDMYENESV